MRPDAARLYPRVSTGFALIADDAAITGSVRDEMEKLWGEGEGGKGRRRETREKINHRDASRK